MLSVLDSTGHYSFRIPTEFAVYPQVAQHTVQNRCCALLCHPRIANSAWHSIAEHSGRRVAVIILASRLCPKGSHILFLHPSSPDLVCELKSQWHH